MLLAMDSIERYRQDAYVPDDSGNDGKLADCDDNHSQFDDPLAMAFAGWQ